MELDDLLAHRQADSAAGIDVLGVEPLEDHEHLVGILGFDPDAVVGHREPPQLPFPDRADTDLRCQVRAAELHRVADQVLPEHAHLGGIGDQGRQRIVRDRCARLLDAEAQGGQGPFHDRFEVDLLGIVVDAAHPGEVEEVVDQGLHPVGAVDGYGDVLVRLGVELPSVAPLEQLREAGDLAQRLLQVVGGHVRELLQLGVGTLEVGGLGVQAPPGLLAEGQLAHELTAHEVDLAAQSPQVRRTGRADGVVEVTSGDGAGVRPQLLQRPVDPAAQAFEDEDGHEGDHGRDRREQPVPQPHGGGEIGSGPVRSASNCSCWPAMA